MATATTARDPRSSAPSPAIAARGRGKERSNTSLIFIGLLWLSLLVAFVTLVILIVTTLDSGWDRLNGMAVQSAIPVRVVRHEANRGYGAALLLDSWALLGRQDLRAAEDTLRRWLAGETVEIDGAAARMLHHEGMAAPRPLHVPLWPSVFGPFGNQRAAEYADGIIGTMQPVDPEQPRSPKESPWPAAS